MLFASPSETKQPSLPSLLLSNLTPCQLTSSSQGQILMELQNDLMLVKADLRRKAQTLAQTQSLPPQLPPSGMPGSCKRRGCGAGAPSDPENRPPQKRQFFQSLFPSRTPTRKYNTRAAEDANLTPSSRILRSRQPSPLPSPVVTPRNLRGKY